MSYFQRIKFDFEKHIESIESLVNSNINEISPKVKNHYDASKKTNSFLNSEDPKKLKLFIEYIATESRGFGWSFPENNIEDLCENSFWEMKNNIKNIVGGMTVIERLFYFGYLEEFEKIPQTHKSDRDRILQNLFIEN